MRDAILELNRVEEEENDLIFANGIEIGQYIRGHKKVNTGKVDVFKYGDEERDYTRFIMEVINTAIKVTQISSDDKRERTVKDIFNEFNEKLFCLAQQDKYHPIINSLDE